MSQYLGDISAYALAVSQGYTGTEEEYAELMASYADVGQIAVDAKDAAVAAKTAAQTAATTATNKASEATTAATTATTKAGEASTSASTATSAKDTAVSASQTATTKATEATTAAATAVSAKDDAVSANTAAQSAKTAAQTAQAGAETAAASVQSSAEQIQTNADDISELKEDFTTTASKEDMLKAFPTDTASGSVASFADGANVPVKSLIVNIDHVQEGSGDPSPDNVRPISGWDAVNVQRTGKNLIESESITGKTVNGITFSKNADGSINIKGTATANVSVSGNNIGTIKSGTYTFSGGEVLPSGIWVSISNKFELMLSASAQTKTSAVDDIDNAYLFIFINNGTTIDLTLYIQLELGSAATAYEPYIGQSINIQLGQTVYGGKLDVLSGELVIDMAMVDLGTLTWTYNPTNEAFFTWSVTDIIKTANTVLPSNIICSKYITLGSSYVYSATGTDKSIALLNGGAVIVKDMAYTDETAFKTAMSGVQLVYELATPITITLTPHEVRSLLGSNNVWADTGDTEVTYRADPTLYIQRLTEPDADMVADANIVSGQYFMVGNTLYKATANIASGATISPNVNCTRKLLSEALNELNA